MEEIIEENATFLWESCATAIKSQVSEVVWQVTFSSVIPIEIKNDHLIIQVPSTVVRDRIEGRYKKLVSETLSEISDDQFNIAINVVTEPISQQLEEVEESNEGFVLQKLIGDGMAFVHAGGTIAKKELSGESLLVEPGCLVAFSKGIDCDIELVGGLKSMFFGGEGMFFVSLRGHGTVWLQSLPFSRLAERVLQVLPAKGSSPLLGD